MGLYSLRLFGGVTTAWSMLTNPGFESKVVARQMRATFRSDVEALFQALAAIASTVPQDPIAGFLYTFTIGWTALIALWGFALQWERFKDWLNRDNIDDLASHISEVSNRDRH